MSTVALIPARAGSQRIPGKNYTPLNGRSPIERTVGAALGCMKIDRVFVSSNDPKVIKVLNKTPIELFHRSARSCEADAPTEVVLTEFCKEVDATTIVLLQCTSPFVNSRHLYDAITMYQEKEADTLISGTFRQLYTYRMVGQTIIPNYRGRSKKRTFVENGAIYIFNRELFLCSGRIDYGYMVGFIMEDVHKLELDTPLDWKVAEFLEREVFHDQKQK